MVTLAIPEREQERTQLEEDLKKMRCKGLLAHLWELKNKEIVRELITTERPNMFNKTIWDQPMEWTFGVWKQVYWFPNSGSSMASRNNTYMDGKFSHIVDLKDGYPVSDCRDAWNRSLLEFIVPIVHSDKPTRVTITIKNTIFGALDGRHPVDWKLVFRDLAQRLVARVGRQKSTPISPFLFHLYHSKDILTEQEDVDYES